MVSLEGLLGLRVWSEFLSGQVETCSHEIFQRPCCLDSTIDSISAVKDFSFQERDFGLTMKAIALARDTGFAFTFGDAFSCRKLLEVAGSKNPTGDKLEQEIPAFPLVENPNRIEDITLEVLEQGVVLQSQIEGHIYDSLSTFKFTKYPRGEQRIHS